MRVIGAYEIIELLGSGGMGAVWRARHRLLDREAAIKLMHLDGHGDDGARARFEAEARVTAALGSPHTIRVFDFGTTDAGDLFYVMELLRGCDLEVLVRRFGPLPVTRVFHLLAQVCDSIGEAHERGLVHGDIKPANLFACRIGSTHDFAKVLDFGLAQPENSNLVETVRIAGSMTWGTPAYMAPESIVGPGGVDRGTDVYALGCVAYFLVTGQLVFQADTPTEMVGQHLYAEPTAPSTKTWRAIPREIDDLILACLQKDPRRRPRDARELGRRIASLTCGTWTQAAAKRWWECSSFEKENDNEADVDGGLECSAGCTDSCCCRECDMRNGHARGRGSRYGARAAADDHHGARQAQEAGCSRMVRGYDAA